jgi:hypothetical protein
VAEIVVATPEAGREVVSHAEAGAHREAINRQAAVAVDLLIFSRRFEPASSRRSPSGGSPRGLLLSPSGANRGEEAGSLAKCTNALSAVLRTA